MQRHIPVSNIREEKAGRGGGERKAPDRCACTAANPEYEPVTNGCRARRHVANAERGEWERVGKLFGTRHHYHRGNTPLLRPNQFLLQDSMLLFLIRSIRSDFTQLTHYRASSKRNNSREKYNLRILLTFTSSFLFCCFKNVAK